MIIRKWRHEEMLPYDLLLLADPSRELVEAYITEGECYVAEENGEKIGVFVIVELSAIAMEIKNIAVCEDRQGQGIGKQLLAAAIRVATSKGYEQVEIGTGNSSIGQLALYQKCGFRISSVIPNFFVDHYDEIIIENGIQCTDMIRLTLAINRKKG